jgi:FtsH-binding integral membrane protein
MRASVDEFLFARYVYGLAAILCFALVAFMIFAAMTSDPNGDLAFHRWLYFGLSVLPLTAGLLLARRWRHWHRKAAKALRRDDIAPTI